MQLPSFPFVCYTNPLYEPRLDCLGIRRDLGKLHLFPSEPWPKEVAARLHTLTQAVIKVGLSRNEDEERLKMQNAMIELRNAQETFEKHNLPEPELLTRMQIDFVRVSNDLNRGKPPGRSR